jgi:hypothetical protein
MRFRVNPGQQVHRGVATYAAGEEFDATGDDARALLDSGLVTRIDKPRQRTAKGRK